jgi:hypothetical protein
MLGLIGVQELWCLPFTEKPSWIPIEEKRGVRLCNDAGIPLQPGRPASPSSLSLFLSRATLLTWKPDWEGPLLFLIRIEILDSQQRGGSWSLTHTQSFTGVLVALALLKSYASQDSCFCCSPGPQSIPLIVSFCLKKPQVKKQRIPFPFQHCDTRLCSRPGQFPI